MADAKIETPTESDPDTETTTGPDENPATSSLTAEEGDGTVQDAGEEQTEAEPEGEAEQTPESGEEPEETPAGTGQEPAPQDELAQWRARAEALAAQNAQMISWIQQQQAQAAPQQPVQRQEPWEGVLPNWLPRPDQQVEVALREVSGLRVEDQKKYLEGLPPATRAGVLRHADQVRDVWAKIEQDPNLLLRGFTPAIRALVQSEIRQSVAPIATAETDRQVSQFWAKHGLKDQQDQQAVGLLIHQGKVTDPDLAAELVLARKRRKQEEDAATRQRSKKADEHAVRRAAEKSNGKAERAPVAGKGGKLPPRLPGESHLDHALRLSELERTGKLRLG